MNKNLEPEKLKKDLVDETVENKVDETVETTTTENLTAETIETATEKVESEAEVKTEPKVVAETEPKVEVEAEPETEVEVEAEVETEPKVEVELETEVEIEPKVEVVAEIKVEVKKEASSEIIVETSEPKSDISTVTKDEIILELKNLKEGAELPKRQYVDTLRHTFYNIRKAEIEQDRLKFDEDAEEGEVFEPSVDPLEDVLKVYINDIKEKRAKKLAEEEQQKENNYKIKLGIIDSIKALSESTDDFNKLFQEFKYLQQKWNDTKLIPQSKSRELWSEYQIHSEKFYDLVKINNELRDYDFKKNLEQKTELCDAAEKLVDDADPVSAFHQLQNFHQQWREIGPVERDVREKLWERFKEISSTINRNYQVHFESLKGLEEDNLKDKQIIIDALKEIDYSKIKLFKDWDNKTKEVLALQAKWRTIGFVPRKVNNEIFEEFRGLCDVFFDNKSGFFKDQRSAMEDNLVKKTALKDRALELKDNTDWNKTTQKLIQIQRDWRSIGPVPRKHSDAIWKEFVDACDHFFEQKKKLFSSQKKDEVENYKEKTDIVEKIKNLDQSLETSKLLGEMRDLQDQWHKIGFVPYKDKDRSYKELYVVVDEHYERLKINKDERRFEDFKFNMEDKSEKSLSKERNHLAFQYNKLKSDLQTYQNNMSFFNPSTKGKENPLLKEVHKKIEALKNEMELIEKKVEALDDSLN